LRFVINLLDLYLIGFVSSRRREDCLLKLRKLKDEAFEIVKGTLELQKDLFREVTVSGGVVLQVQRIQDHNVRVWRTIQWEERPLLRLSHLILKAYPSS
jgi:hypothetical protein